MNLDLNYTIAIYLILRQSPQNINIFIFVGKEFIFINFLEKFPRFAGIIDINHRIKKYYEIILNL